LVEHGIDVARPQVLVRPCVGACHRAGDLARRAGPSDERNISELDALVEAILQAGLPDRRELRIVAKPLVSEGYSESSKPPSRATVPPHLREIDDPPFVAIQGGLLRQQLVAVPPSGLAQLRGKGAIGAQPKCLTK
jgi:hypothetical protein